MDSPQIESQLPLSEVSFYILLSLAGEPRHGYAIMKDVASLSGGRIDLSAGTLYGALKRMLEQGWIERLELAGELDESGRPRKVYRLSALGQGVLSAETERLRALVAAAARRSPGAQPV